MNTNTTDNPMESGIDTGSESAEAVSNRVQATLRQTQARLGEWQRDLADRTKYAAQSTDTYIHEKPWSAVCAAVSIGFVIGLLLGRR